MNKTVHRCGWCGQDPLYQQYHDHEWGKPVLDDQTLFEFLILESAQAGLSWITILRKRENYRQNFAGFDPQKVAHFGQNEIERILKDPGIVRNRAKVEAAIQNAKVFLEIQAEFGSFLKYLYTFLPKGQPIINNVSDYKKTPAKTPESEMLANALKRKGMKFFGPVTCYAFMQAVGMVNDHEDRCSFKTARPASS